MNDSEKTSIILEKLKFDLKKNNKWRTNILFPELRLGSGYDDIAQRRIDLFVISSERGNYTTAFEIKVSRSDFTRDIKNPIKQRGARLYASNFYYVAPKGMLKEEEIPLWSGLLEYDFESRNMRKVIPAPLQSRNNPSWGLICSLVRRVKKETYLGELQEAEANNEVLKRKIKRLEGDLEGLERNIKSFLDGNIDEELLRLTIR